MNYEYIYYEADDNITYRPVHSAESVIKYSNELLEIELEHKYIGEVFVDPVGGSTLHDVLLGKIGLQYKVYDSFYFYTKVDNFYNKKFNYREYYPEPGVTWVAGLKILI